MRGVVVFYYIDDRSECDEEWRLFEERGGGEEATTPNYAGLFEGQ
jgi:hypothetical protein